MAGLNFKWAKDDLGARGLLEADFASDLTLAFNQEIKHAVMARDMLKILGFQDRGELREIMFWLHRVTENVAAQFDPNSRAYVCILLNHRIEDKFANGGVKAARDAICTLADTLPLETRAPLRDKAWEFYTCVLDEEKWHVKLDERAMAIYAGLFPDLNINAVLKQLRSRSLPLYRAMRVKMEFFKNAQASRSRP